IGTYSAGRNPKGGIAVDASGDVWVMNAGVSSVTKLSPAGNIIGTYKGVTTGGNLGDFTGFALQNFVMRKPGSGHGGGVKARPIQGPPPSSPPVAAAPPLRTPWTRLKDIPFAVQYAALDEKDGLIMAGGVRQREESDLWVFDPLRQTWSQLPSIHTQHLNAAAAFMDGRFYVAGGSGVQGPSDRLEVYDPETRTWEARAPVPTAGMSRGAVVDGIFYVMGAQCSGQFLGYDPRADSWKRLSPMPTGRCDPGLAVSGGRIYALGGHPISGPPYDTVEVYDPKSDSWSKAPSMPMARTRFAAPVLGGSIHVLGGEGSGTRYLAAHEVYNAATGLWYEAEPLTEARSSPRAVAAGGKIYLFSGHLDSDRSAASAVAEVYDPAQDRLRPIRNHEPAPQEEAGAVGLWRLDEGSGSTAHDSSGNGSDGTLVGSPAWSAGRSGSALSFNGADTGVRVPDSAALNPSQFTIEAWIKPAAGWGGIRDIVTKTNGPSTAYCIEYNFAMIESKLFLNMGRNGSGPHASAVGTTAIPTNTWTFAAGTYDGATLKVYVNGRLDGTAPWPYGLSRTEPQAMGIGYTPGTTEGGCGPGEWFNGQIDEVRMLDFAATDAQIAQDAARPRPAAAGKLVMATPAYAAPRIAPQPAPQVQEAEALPARKGEPRPDDFALVIGVERYRSLPAANFAERDAASFARYAQAVLGVPEENVILLTGQ
ncbi:MAG: hypothetical protein NTY77_06450, partial [Elusimicrobia bacterium]|nr:hypothetical protein [Elusimicrobiota bacterium]